LLLLDLFLPDECFDVDLDVDDELAVEAVGLYFAVCRPAWAFVFPLLRVAAECVVALLRWVELELEVPL
jgi:hypothetical protein